jgi:hypothetical protein
MSAMTTLARPKKITFAEMRAHLPRDEKVFV